MDVFQAFVTTTYNFLIVDAGTEEGDIAILQPTSTGIFKHRDGMVAAGNQEVRTSATSLKVRPSEDFIEEVGGNMVGHGIRVDDQDYRVLGQTKGMNYHTGVLEHYRLTLEKHDYADVTEATS